MAHSGPDSSSPTILHTYISLISNAKTCIDITTPYLIPNQEFITALIIAAHSGVKIRLLLPKVWDGKIVEYASRGYYAWLLKSWIEIHEYTKGFIHAKTLVKDNEVSIIGTANLDIRSFDLNFEIISLIYDAGTAKRMSEMYDMDLQDAKQVDLETFRQRSRFTELLQEIAKLFSSIL